MISLFNVIISSCIKVIYIEMVKQKTNLFRIVELHGRFVETSEEGAVQSIRKLLLHAKYKLFLIFVFNVIMSDTSLKLIDVKFILTNHNLFKKNKQIHIWRIVYAVLFFNG